MKCEKTFNSRFFQKKRKRKNGINWGLSHEKKPENSSTEYSTMAANIRWKHSRIDRFDDLQTNHFLFFFCLWNEIDTRKKIFSSKKRILSLLLSSISAGIVNYKE